MTCRGLASRWFAVLPALCLGGCAELHCLYRPALRQARDPVVDAALVVPPLIDRRESDNTRAGLFWLVPLVPFGWMDYSVPEEHWDLNSQYNMYSKLNVGWPCWSSRALRPTNWFAYAIASEIDAARIFRTVHLNPRESGDYRLVGELRSVRYRAKVLSYGLSSAALFLWFVGVPCGTVDNELEIRLVLTRAGSEAPLWEHTIHGETGRVAWFYADNDFLYDELVREAMPAALASLERALASER